MQFSQSYAIALNAVSSTILCFHQAIRDRRLVKQNMPKYSALKVINTVNQLGDQLLVQDPSTGPGKFELQNEPKALQIDSLLPVSVQIANQNQYQKHLTQFKKQQETRMHNLQQTRTQKSLKNNKQSSFQELEYEKERNRLNSNDGLINQLRKEKELNFKKIEDEQVKRRKRLEQDARQSKKKDKGKEEKINFDYNGNIIKVVTNPRGNMVSDLLKSRPSKESLKTKQISVQAVQTEVNVKSQKKNQIKKRRIDQVEFSEIKTLLEDFKISKGSKVNQNKTILEDKKTRLSIPEIKKSLSTSRISRQDYERLKQATITTQPRQVALPANNYPVAQQEDKKLRKRAHSETNIFQNIKGKLTVNDLTLKATYITKITNSFYDFPEQQSDKSQDTQQDPNKLKLDDNDRYNLSYMKGNSKKKDSQKSTALKLPRLSVNSKSSECKDPSKPKFRQKVKDNNLVRRQLRKKFEDKLRT